jgi:hypothetical protein
MTTEMTRTVITKPGIYPDLDEADYHADPVPYGSLSASGAKLLLPPGGCPAKFRYQQGRPQPPKAHFDLGTAAHHLVLGVGPQPVELDFGNRRSNAYKDAAANARAAGQVPLLPEQMAQVQDMAAAIGDHPDAAALFAPGTGSPEQSMFWTEKFYWQEPGGHVPVRTHGRPLWRRARLDWLSHQHLKDGRLVIPDYKTADSSEPHEFMKAVNRFRYHMSAAWYIDAVRAVGLVPEEEDRDPAFIWVVQEKEAPYVVTVIELSPDAKRMGQELNTEAMDRYSEARRTKRWIGYSDKIEMPSLPKFAEYQHEEIVNE